MLGYDVDPRGQRLSVNAEEAERVRAMFALYLEHESLPRVARELAARGWSNKRWRTRSGKESGGEPFTRVGLRRLLANVLYAGKVRYKDEVHNGERPALVDPAVFRQAQQLLRSGDRGAGGPPARNRPGRCCAACCVARRVAAP
jgi:site-specific DNA recombinase